MPIEATKDLDGEHPVASDWRPIFGEIVKAFVRGDYALSGGIAFVGPVSAETAEQIGNYVADYGETLTELSDDTWKTSIARWMGNHWDVLVDLWTIEAGRSDMVLHAEVAETANGLRVEIYMVYVP
jgi:hypothetical protein